MRPPNDSSPSFSAGRKWNLTAQAILTFLALATVIGLVNYLAARHHARFSWAGPAQGGLSPLSFQVLGQVTNEVKVVLYCDRQHPLFDMTLAMLKSYANASRHITLEVIDPERDPSAALAATALYGLRQKEDRDLVIFECQRRMRFVYPRDLSDLDLNEFLAGRSGEIKRVAFKGEMLFTSAILTVITPRQLKAYFLEGHDEHQPDKDDGLEGYSTFASVLRENSVLWEKLNLVGTNGIPADCNLLIVAGPRGRFSAEELDKIDRYLKQGGRLFVLLNNASVIRPTGLEDLIEDWGVLVGRNIVLDEAAAVASNKRDMRVFTFSKHRLINPIVTGGLYLVLPRSIERDRAAARGSDATQVEEIAFTSPRGHIITDLRPDGRFYKQPGDREGQIPLIVAVERGGVRNVSADRGATRMVVAGESIFLANDAIESAANHEFAAHAVNWLLARDEMLIGIPPRPIKEYKLTVTKQQMRRAEWIFLAGMPGTALLLGGLVWLRRRR